MRRIIDICDGRLLRSAITAIGIGICMGGCVSGAPTLTPSQERQVSNIIVYKTGEQSAKQYQILGPVSAADCSGAPAGGRLWGNAEQAIDTLKRKAAALDADAVVNTRCDSVPFLNNCWAAQKCSGDAVKLLRPERNSP